MSGKERKDVVNWCIPVTRQMDVQVEQAVASDSHVSKSELVRDAVRRLLDGTGGSK
jgi:Arc/MetJ-type ribon-helix-helix transcriptional regulator